MIYSQPAETEKLIYRFIWGELPLFACERWIKAPETQKYLPKKLKKALQPYLQTPAESNLARRQQLRGAFDVVVDQGQYQSWLLLEILPFILNEDPRACLALEQVFALYQQDLKFLEILAQAFRTGEGSAHFDWNQVRGAVPHLKPVCRLLIQVLTNGEITIDQSGLLVSQSLSDLLFQSTDWRRANLVIQSWEQSQSQLFSFPLDIDPA